MIFIGNNYILHKSTIINLDTIDFYQRKKVGLLFNLNTINIILKNGDNFSFKKYLKEKDLDKLINIFKELGINKKK